MLLKTHGLVLNIMPYSRTSHVVDWLLAGYGRTPMLVKGAQRPKGGHMGQYDLFYECEVVFYDRAPRRLNVLRECAPLDTHSGLRTDWTAASCASYFSSLIAHSAPQGLLHDDLYHGLNRALQALEARGGSIQIVSWFELAVLRMVGMGLSLWKCPSCGAGIPQNATEAMRVSSATGGVLCRNCAARGTARSPILLTPGGLAMLRAWQLAESPQAAQATVPTAGQLAEVCAVLGDFLAYHLDIPAGSRNAVLQTLRRAAELRR